MNHICLQRNAKRLPQHIRFHGCSGCQPEDEDGSELTGPQPVGYTGQQAVTSPADSCLKSHS